MLEPGVGSDGRLATVAIVVQQLLALVNVPRGHEDEVGYAADVMQFGLAVAIFAVVDQPAHTARLFGGVHAVSREARRGRGQNLSQTWVCVCVRGRIRCGRLPVGFAEVLEVVHVAAGCWVLGVLRLPLLGVVDLQQVAVVLYHVLALLERSRGKHCSPFSLDMLDLRGRF